MIQLFENINRVFEDPERKGKACSLEIIVSMKDQTTGAKFIYGTETMGPPKEIRDFIEKAIELTNDWYEQASRNNTTDTKRKWWQPWK